MEKSPPPSITDALPTRLFAAALLITILTLVWAGVQNFTHYYALLDTRAGSNSDIAPIAQHIHTSMYIIAAAVIALLVTWYCTFRSFRGWRNELIVTRQQERKQRVFLDTLLDHMPLSIFAKDVKDSYKIVLVNRRAEEVFAVPREQLIGTTDYDHWLKEEADFFRSIDEQVMKERKVMEIDAEPVTTPRGTFTAHTLKIPIYDETGNPAILLGILEDVTDRINAQQDLQQAKNDAERANQAKSDFLAKMSHELRTPLNSILGLTRMLMEDKTLDGEHKSMAVIVHKSATNLLEIVNDILDISKIEAGGITLENIGFDFRDVVQNVVNAMTPVASSKGVILRFHDIQHDIPYIKGDPFRLGRVLTNLVSNAIKYTHNHADASRSTQGSVTISVESRSLPRGQLEIHCAVNDNGIGIPADKLDMIFEKFTQADESITRKYGGTGLGLAITKELVEMMGGQLGVESIYGAGSTFWFIIPFDITDRIEDRTVPTDMVSPPQGGLRRARRIPAKDVAIMVAEDHILNQDFIRRLLIRMGFYSIDIVEDGFGVLDACQKKSYDIILMDCHMPHKDGYETACAIRDSEQNSDRRVPIIALTADVMQGTEERCLAAGMNAYVKKPIDPDILKEVMAQWIAFDSDMDRAAATPFLPNMPANTSMLEKYAQDMDDIKKFVALFTKQSEDIIAILRQHATNEQTQVWKEAAHKFKGGAGTMGAERLRQIAQDAEYTEPTAARARKLEELTAEYERVKLFLHGKYF